MSKIKRQRAEVRRYATKLQQSGSFFPDALDYARDLAAHRWPQFRYDVQDHQARLRRRIRDRIEHGESIHHGVPPILIWRRFLDGDARWIHFKTKPIREAMIQGIFAPNVVFQKLFGKAAGA